MSALEFAQWQLMYENEALNPESQRMQHAALLATILQGASTRRDGKHWSAAHFLGPDPWLPAAATGSAAAPRRVNVVQQVRAMNARRRGGA
ncbi:hypothetical protein [Variovorax sp. W2I14]|uniref:hypothetical protein n=1 Tax=Variovorax sp. W2I14 TaxID=3042290 RepID=UPI003D20BF14